MDKFIVDHKGVAEEFRGQEKIREIDFPVCLAARYGRSVKEFCHEFILNLSRGQLFIKTDSPFPNGSRISLNIYIPPDSKILGSFECKVLNMGKLSSFSNGMYLKMLQYEPDDVERLAAYLEERLQLVNVKA